VARFYGWSHDYISSLPSKTLLKYLESIEILEAQEALVQMTLADFSRNYKQEDRKKLHRKLKRTAEKLSPNEQPKVLSDDLPALIQGLLNGR